MQDDQPEVQGPAVCVSVERGATNSPIGMYVYVCAYISFFRNLSTLFVKTVALNCKSVYTFMSV